MLVKTLFFFLTSQILIAAPIPSNIKMRSDGFEIKAGKQNNLLEPIRQGKVHTIVNKNYIKIINGQVTVVSEKVCDNTTVINIYDLRDIEGGSLFANGVLCEIDLIGKKYRVSVGSVLSLNRRDFMTDEPRSIDRKTLLVMSHVSPSVPSQIIKNDDETNIEFKFNSTNYEDLNLKKVQVEIYHDFINPKTNGMEQLNFAIDIEDTI